MRFFRRRAPLAALAAVLVATLAACSGGSGGSNDSRSSNDSGSSDDTARYYVDGQPMDSSVSMSVGPSYDFMPLRDLKSVVPAAPEEVVNDYAEAPPELRNIPIEQRAILQTVRRIDANDRVPFLSGTVYSVPPAYVDSSRPTGPKAIRDENEFLAQSTNPIVYLERHEARITLTVLTHQQTSPEFTHPPGEYGSEDGYFTFVTPLLRRDAGPVEGNSFWKARTFDGSCQPADVSADCLYFQPTQPEAGYLGNEHVIINGQVSVYIGGIRGQYELAFRLDPADPTSLIPVADDRNIPPGAPISPQGSIVTELQVIQLRSKNTAAFGAEDLLNRTAVFARQ